jgi:hypothetical protein
VRRKTGTNAGQQLLERERFDNVVVGPEFQPLDAIGDGIAGGEKDDRQRAAVAQPTGEGETTAARGHHVEDR